MLGKTANGLYWMYRCLERAENVTRLVETGQRIALTRSGAADDDWASVMRTAGELHGFEQRHDEVTKDAAINWLLRATDNPSSVSNLIAQARQNARMVRTALTVEVWEAVNACHMTAKVAFARKVPERDLPGVLGRIRQQTALVRGVTHGTMLRDDIYDFARIGTFIERADSTARILDVKFYVLLPSVSAVGSRLDNVQWETILRSVSARGGYRKVYGSSVNPGDIARFLVLDKRMPRSLNFCVSKILDNLNYLASDYGFRTPSHMKAEGLVGLFNSRSIEDILESGLHEFILRVLRMLSDLGSQIEIDYRFYA